MKVTDLLSNSLKNIIRNKNYLFIFTANIICIGLFLGSLLISTTYKNKIYNNFNNNPLMNTIGVMLDTDKNGNEYSEKELNDILDKISNIKNVSGYFHQDYASSGASFDTESFETIEFYALVDGIRLPDQTYKKDLKLNEIIIPKKFYKEHYSNYGEVDEEKIIDGDTLVGEEITLYYDVFDCQKEDVVDTIEFKMKVVGTYDSALTGFNMYHCFTSIDTIKEIRDNSLINITEVYETSNLYYIQIDNAKNIDRVKRKIKLMGLSSDIGVVYILNEYYNKYVYLMNTISVLSFIFLIVFKILFIRKIVNDNKQIIFINMLNGYKKKDIVLEESIKNALIDILSIIIISLLIIISINYYNSNYTNLIAAGYIAKFPILSILLTIIFIFILEYITSQIIISNKINKGLTALLRED